MKLNNIMGELNQNYCDLLFVQIKSEWDKLVADSGVSETVFIATDSKAVEFLSAFQQAREQIEASYGLKMPDLVDGMMIRIIT